MCLSLVPQAAGAAATAIWRWRLSCGCRRRGVPQPGLVWSLNQSEPQLRGSGTGARPTLAGIKACRSLVPQPAGAAAAAIWRRLVPCLLELMRAGAAASSRSRDRGNLALARPALAGAGAYHSPVPQEARVGATAMVICCDMAPARPALAEADASRCRGVPEARSPKQPEPRPQRSGAGARPTLAGAGAYRSPAPPSSWSRGRSDPLPVGDG